MQPATAIRSPSTRAEPARFLLVALAALAIVLLVVYAVASAYMATEATRAKRSLPTGSPADVGLAYEPVAFESAVDRVPLSGWYLPSTGERAVVMVHGVDGHRWDAVHDVPQLAATFVRSGYDVLVFDLRGCGESGGDRLGLGWLERQDVMGAVALVRSRGIESGRIALWGESFGGASVLLAAPELPEVAVVVADSAFYDARPLLDGEINRRTGLPPLFTPGLSFFTGVFYGLNLAEIPPERAVPKISPRPILFIHGDADQRIPVEHSRRLRSASQNPADDLWIVPGAGHANSFKDQPAAYASRVLALFGAALA